MDIIEGMEILEMAATELDKAIERAEAAQASSLMYTDTMAQMYKDERSEILANAAKERESIRKHYQKLLLAMALLMSLIIGGLILGTAYIISNFDIAFGNSQDVSVGGNGDSTIESGIYINPDGDVSFDDTAPKD